MTNEVIASGVITTQCGCEGVEYCGCYSDALETFDNACKIFFTVDACDDCDTHTVERRARVYGEKFRNGYEFILHLTNRISDHTIRWKLTGKKLQISFSHHDAPVSAPVTVTPIEWVECRNPECVEINAKESFQNEILGNPDFKYGYCKYCAPQFKIEFENMTYPYQVKFMFESKSHFVTEVVSDLEPFPNLWWFERSDEPDSDFERASKESHWATITKVVEGVTYTMFIKDQYPYPMLTLDERNQITELALAKAKSSGVVFDKWDCVLIHPMDIVKN